MRKDLLTVIAVLILLVVGGLMWASSNNVGDDDTTPPPTDSTPGGDDDDTTSVAADTNADGVDDRTAQEEPVVSDSQNIKVTSPDPNQMVGSHFLAIVGEARVFENTYNWRVKDDDGTVIAEGFGTATAPDIGQFGPLVSYAQYSATPGEAGTVEVYSLSARDGSEQDMVRIPVTFGNDARAEVFYGNRELVREGDSCVQMFARGRDVLDSDVPAIRLRETLLALLAGPTGAETTDDYFTSIPDGTRLNSLHVNDYAAEVRLDFSSEIDAGGSCRVLAIRTQIEETVKAVMGDEFSVVISVDGGDPDEALQP